MRHWSLTLMLQKPARSPLSCSSRLPGGTRKSCTFVEAAMTIIFLLTALLTSRENARARAESMSWYTSSVARSPKLTITF